ncbi:FecCD family ABC transporter permease [Chitinophaga nivalis]|uniref:Iron ABC transporter permease n=1 Tax=Chitinophaga nivalis TaxID=2991709 RepID=A0ABT3IT92_9BACT|nr:iron ABC transporter permease [Chitinophaga nivalis]MCW3463109.1 iron ABC transporter permease [Chitinophaga nivalis]MCW3487201.1 iron ABC transporter permease [Chitinophaga nivalis]
MKQQLKKTGTVSLLSIVLVLVVLIATGTGAMYISPLQVLAILLHKIGIAVPVSYAPAMEGVLWMIRLPRVLMGVLTGAGLAVAGAAMQGLFRNPMADPGLIGISSGASLSAVGMIVFQLAMPAWFNSGWLHYYALNIAAFGGAFLAAYLIIRIARTDSGSSVTMMLLGGIAINALCMALVGLLTYLSTNEQLRSIVFWTMGSLGGASWQTLGVAAPFILLPVLLLPRLSAALDVFALGEREAMHSGVNVQPLKVKLLLLATMAVAAGVSVTGIIGFVGLVVPHIVRQFTGPRYGILFPCAALAGATLLTIADLFCRTVLAPAELPVGIVTAIIGAPFFIWLIIKEKRTLIV